MTRERLNAADLAEIQERADAATEGPWFIEGNTVMNRTRSYTVVLFGESAEDDHDSQFIACSRSDVPSLVAEVRACWEERERLTASLRQLHDYTLNYTTAPFGNEKRVEHRIKSLVDADNAIRAVDALREPQEAS